jgi:PKD repeat protein
MRVRRWGLIVGLVLVVGMVSGCGLFNAAPVVNFSWSPQDPLARTDVQFSDLSSDTGGLFGGGGVVTWLWNFGDGSSSPMEDPKHEYAKGGPYNVQLTVTDGGGKTATAMRAITVTPSLAGRWTGTLTDTTFVPLGISFELQHSASGGISGTLYVATTAFPVSSASFNATTREVQIMSATIIFRGTLDANERRISGYWYDQFGTRGEDWSVSLM